MTLNDAKNEKKGLSFFTPNDVQNMTGGSVERRLQGYRKTSNRKTGRKVTGRPQEGRRKVAGSSQEGHRKFAGRA